MKIYTRLWSPLYSVYACEMISCLLNDLCLTTYLLSDPGHVESGVDSLADDTKNETQTNHDSHREKVLKEFYSIFPVAWMYEYDCVSNIMSSFKTSVHFP